jgi:hypothetical protein
MRAHTAGMTFLPPPGSYSEQQLRSSGMVPPSEPPTPSWPTDQPRRKRTLSGWVRALRRKLSRSQ